MKITADIALEDQRKAFLEQKTANDRKAAETKEYVLSETLKPYKDINWKTLTALVNNKDSCLNIALAFCELAENADKIGNLNISPDLLENLIRSKKPNRLVSNTSLL